ncbi:MAG: hypothetical protein H6559_08680 [Lewinellaceae bacterium]|nr:hypothetical protein [Lewinellaceae bacterium]
MKYKRSNINPIRETEAVLWDGKNQLEGTLILTRQALAFRQHAFPKGHLHWEVQLQDIKELQTFLLYDMASNGMRITSISGREDLFVITEPGGFIHAIRKAQERQKNF